MILEFTGTTECVAHARHPVSLFLRMSISANALGEEITIVSVGLNRDFTDFVAPDAAPDAALYCPDFPPIKTSVSIMCRR